jgi:hypothetical protein
MAGIERYKILTTRRQVLRCKEAAALQLARLRASVGDKEAALRAKKLAEEAAQREAALDLRRQRERKGSA